MTAISESTNLARNATALLCLDCRIALVAPENSAEDRFRLNPQYRGRRTLMASYIASLQLRMVFFTCENDFPGANKGSERFRPLNQYSVPRAIWSSQREGSWTHFGVLRVRDRRVNHFDAQLAVTQ